MSIDAIRERNERRKADHIAYCHSIGVHPDPEAIHWNDEIDDIDTLLAEVERLGKALGEHQSELARLRAELSAASEDTQTLEE